MDRRNFLGLAIGMVAGVPFIATQVQEPKFERRKKQLLTALWCGMIRPQDCTIKIWTNDCWIAGPKYLSHVFSETDLKIKFQELELTRSMVIPEFILSAPNGWSQQMPMGHVYWSVGDILKLEYGVTL